MVFQSCDIRIHGMVAHGKAVVSLRLIQQIDGPEFCAYLDIIIIAKMHHFFGRFNSTQYIRTCHFPAQCLNRFIELYV